MITSILDQDLYTLTVGQAIEENFPDAEVTYQFTNRKGVGFSPEFMRVLQAKIDTMACLSLTKDEGTFIQDTQRFIKPSYVRYLRDYRFNPKEVRAELTPTNNLSLNIKGLWHRTIYWEVPLLALISESYFETIDTHWTEANQVDIIRAKGQRLNDNGVFFGDFGTRRRRNYDAQDRVVRELKQFKNFTGTSNVHLAHKHNVKAMGTMSHQWPMGVSALDSLRHANRYALRRWNDVYQGDLGIALPDTFGTAAFFADFDGQLARMYDGVRHDSGDPYVFALNVVEHYKKLHIDPMSKIIIFSDGLDVNTAIQLKIYCNRIGIRCGFGIGTHFTNDFTSTTDIPTPALNIVIKLRSVRKNASSEWIQVVKLSDIPSKATGDKDALRVARWTFFGTPLDETL